MSYHDLHITIPAIPRTAISDLPFCIEVSCHRATGWRIGRIVEAEWELLAGEFDSGGLRLDVGGHVILDTLRGVDDGAS